MSTIPVQENLSPVQAAIYGLALSIDSLLLNGIQYGAILHVGGNGFLRERADKLLGDLAALEQEISAVPVDLPAKCRELLDGVTQLSSFRSLTRPELSSSVSRILMLREECVRLIQELELAVHSPRPFYLNRTADSTTAINRFLADLESNLAQAWTVAHAEPNAD